MKPSKEEKKKKKCRERRTDSMNNGVDQTKTRKETK